MLTQALIWYLAIAVGGIAAFGALHRWGVGSGAAAAVARVAGWTLAGYAGWMAGWLGLQSWWWVGLAGLGAVAAWGWRGIRGVGLATLLEPEAVGLGAFLLLAWLRLPALAVQGTEKPMDLAILSTLMRPGTVPPSDPWLAGHSLPYYYWGFVPWLLPIKLLGLAPDVAFNLLVPTAAAATAQAGWALARGLGGSRRTGLIAGFLVVFAGTPDSWRQWLSGKALAALDLWASSRQISGTITEFPLFTFQLGDLHPHLLCLPLLLVALLLAGRLHGVEGDSGVPVLAVALPFGASAAANPWCAIPVGLGVALMAAARPEGFLWPRGGSVRVWLRIACVGAMGWLLFAPFWLSFHPPASGFGLVHTATRPDQLILFLGAVLLPPVLVAWQLGSRAGGFDAARRQLVRATWLASMVIVAVATGSVALALAVGVGALLGMAVFGGGTRRVRPAWALTLVALGLIALMETAYLKDPYGADLYRMNTVFKSSHLAFALLAVLAPVLLGWLRRRRPMVAAAAAVLVVAAGLPHLFTLSLRAARAPADGWGGLAWMAPGEIQGAAWLRRLPARSTLIEGLGDAYSDAARMSSASGVPAVLGWENHEWVWRGDRIRDELSRRRSLVEDLYRCGDERKVKQLADELHAPYVVIGALEGRRYPAAGLAAVRRSGRVVFSAGVCTIVRIDE